MTKDEFRKIRLAMGMTQQRFALKIGITAISVSRIERGVIRRVKSRYAARVQKLLDTMPGRTGTVIRESYYRRTAPRAEQL